ncbi:MAG: thioredoxin family protein [Parvularculaceae bacterium]|nr:thioredoxin family protein [Parvularculaceae bacterium]
MRFLAHFAVLFALTAPVQAASSVITDHARSQLVLESNGVEPGGAVTLGFAQELERGWHVYWKNPGDSGLPLDFQWTLPPGVEAGEIEYPAPHRIPVGPLVNFGHEGAPVFLTSLKAGDDAAIGSTIDIALKATWLICADICVPETGEFSLSVPVVEHAVRDPEKAGLFSNARAAAPARLKGEAHYAVRGARLRLDAPALGAPAYFFPDTPGLSEPAGEQRARVKGDRLTLEIAGGAELGALSGPLAGVIQYGEGDGARSFALRAEPAAAGAGGLSQGPSRAGSLAALLLAAFFGGAILNLMPCVFPILFVKAASMAKAASGDAPMMRRHGALYAAGVVASFAALGGLLLALRAGGEEIGWGFHLQSPGVVAVSAYVLFAVGLNLAGAFHVGSSVQNLGSGLVAGRGGDFSAFMTGVLAVIVAAPCVGPLLTAPVGAAAVLPAFQGFSIFIAMALGLAAPYVLISFAPGAARALPKPGPWMDRFRQALAFPVFAAAGFFIWVLAAQTGSRGLALAIAGLITVAFAARLWEWGRSGRLLKIAALVVLALALVPVAMLRPVAASAPKAGAIAFDPADIALRRAAGEPVFVDFTAAWCVTCQVNKLTVLSAAPVRKAFADAGVAFVTADWTNRDPVIERALAEFGANGVPLYVFYPPGGEAIVLDQPLSERRILEALSAAR